MWPETVSPLGWYVVAGSAAVGELLMTFQLVRLLRESRLAEWAVQAEHTVQLDAGPVVLHAAGPRGADAFGGTSYAVFAADGSPLPCEAPSVRTMTTTGSTVRVSVLQFVVPRLGFYRIVVSGLPSSTGDESCRLSLIRPLGATFVGHVLGLIALGGITIAAIAAAQVATASS